MAQSFRFLCGERADWDDAYRPMREAIGCWQRDLAQIHQAFWDNVLEIAPDFPAPDLPFEIPRLAPAIVTLRVYVFSPGLEYLIAAFANVADTAGDALWIDRQKSGFGIWSLDESELGDGGETARAALIDRLLITPTMWQCKDGPAEGSMISPIYPAVLCSAWASRNLVDWKILGPK